MLIYFVAISLRDIIQVWGGKDEAVNGNLLWLVRSKGRRRPSFACACRESAEILTKLPALRLNQNVSTSLNVYKTVFHFNIRLKYVYKFVFCLKNRLFSLFTE